MTDVKEIILQCPGGACPIKKVCVTHEPDKIKIKNSLVHPPFRLEGIVVRCTYFALKK